MWETGEGGLRKENDKANAEWDADLPQLSSQQKEKHFERPLFFLGLVDRQPNEKQYL